MTKASTYLYKICLQHHGSHFEYFKCVLKHFLKEGEVYKWNLYHN